MSAPVKTDGRTFSAAEPKALFSVNMEAEERRNRYVATTDGERFLVVALSGGSDERLITVQLGALNQLVRR